MALHATLQSKHTMLQYSYIISKKEFSMLNPQDLYKARQGEKDAQYRLGEYSWRRYKGNICENIEYLKKAAIQHHLAAAQLCCEIGSWILNSQTTDKSQAAEYFFVAATNGIEDAKRQFSQSGDLYQKLISQFNSRAHFTKNLSNAALLFSKAYQYPEFGLENQSLALKFLEKATEFDSRNIEAVNMLADAYYFAKFGLKQDLNKASRILTMLTGGFILVRGKIDPHESATYFRLGEMCENGKGMKLSLAQAIEYYQFSRSCKAYYRLGVIFYNKYQNLKSKNSYETDRMKKSAMDYFELCGENKDAYYYLGLIYNQSENHQQSEKYYLLAAKMNSAIAATRLATIYSTGKYGQEKKQSAIDWYKKAAKLGHVNAHYDLSVAFNKGDLVEKNLLKAYKFCLKAAQSNHEEAIKDLQVNQSFSHLNKLSKLVNHQLETVKRYYDLENQLGYIFKDPEHLFNALDRRRANACQSEPPFQKYEFVGDTILNVTCAILLTQKKPDHWQVHDLHLAKVNLVRNDTVLPKIAKQLRLYDFIQKDITEANHNITEKMLADATEALIGAICLDKDVLVATEVTERLLLADIHTALKTSSLSMNKIEVDLKKKPSQTQIISTLKNPGKEKYSIANTDGLKISHIAESEKLEDKIITPRSKTLLNACCASKVPLEEFQIAARNAPHAMQTCFYKKQETPLMRLIKAHDQIKKHSKLVLFEHKIKVLIDHGSLWQQKNSKKQTAAEKLLSTHPKIAKHFRLA